MNSLKVPLIIFALVLLVLVGASMLLGNPSGSSETATLTGVTEVLPELNLSESDIQACLDSGEQDARVRRDIESARALSFSGTPGVILFDKQTGNAALMRGAYPFEAIAQSIDQMLNNDLSEGDILLESEALGVKLEIERIESLEIVEDDHLRGNPDARITLLEYSDVDCPYCAQFHGTAIRLVNQFPEDLNWVYRHYPLPQLHPTSISKAIVSECAQQLGGDEAFWGVIDSYYAKNLSNQ